MTKTIEGRLNVNWDAYWKGFMSFPLIEIARISLVRGAYNRLLKSFKSNPHPKFCELGAGTSSVSRYLADKFQADTTIVDSNPQAIYFSRKNFENYSQKFSAVKHDVFDLQDHAHQFDLVHSGGLIEHFINEAREDIIRVHCDLVRDKGYILILVPMHNFWYRILNEGIFKFLHLLDQVPEVPWSLEEVTKVFNKFGFKVVASTRVLTELGVLVKRV